MAKKKRKEGEPKSVEIPPHGIPVFSLAEKLTVVLPIKVGPSLKRAVKQVTNNVSKFGREAIIEKLSRLEEETEDFE